MPNSDFHVPKLSLAYAKIVATPTAVGWSQVYNAGSLFSALSLTIKNQTETEEATLPATGKDILNNLEAEFFSLEKKTLDNIKTAIKKSFENVPAGITADACLAYFKDNILYLFIIGKGKIIMKRHEKLGLLVEKNDYDAPILTASGHLQPGDILLLQTDHFTQNVPNVNITTAFELQLPNDIAESLSPHVHEKEDGSQAAIIVSYNGAAHAQHNLEENTPLTKPPIAKEKKEETALHPKPSFRFSFPKLKKFSPKIKFPAPRLTLLQKISLLIGALILIALIISIITTKTQEEKTKYQTLYQQISSQAQKKYDEGKTLAKLNPNLAQDDFTEAQKILRQNINKFKTDSPERANLNELLRQIEAGLTPAASPLNKISPIIADIGEFDLLNIEKTKQGISFSQDKNSVYLLTDKAITSIDKTNGSKKDIILNNQDWDQAIALSAYQGNIYILDKKEGVIKFIAAQNGFGKNAYFKEAPPNLSQTKNMSIDGSIWILMGDGKILKYTKGEQENFSITGLNLPLKNPTKIFTTRDLDSLYILDNGNGRIVKLGKNGEYQSQYHADILSSALDFEILDNDQKALILSKDKIYSLPL